MWWGSGRGRRGLGWGGVGWGGGVRVDVNEELKFLYKKKWGRGRVGGGRGGRVWGGGQGGCERRIEVFVKIKNKKKIKKFFGGVRRSGRGGRVGGSG